MCVCVSKGEREVFDLCTTRLLKICTSNRGSPPAFVVCVLYEVFGWMCDGLWQNFRKSYVSVVVVVVIVIIMILIVCACTIFE